MSTAKRVVRRDYILYYFPFEMVPFLWDILIFGRGGQKIDQRDD